MATVSAGWIGGDWIYSQIASQNARYWIAQGWIWGPLGAADITTGYWISEDWIFGPKGAADATTGFFISKRHIFGPSERFPFARPTAA